MAPFFVYLFCMFAWANVNYIYYRNHTTTLGGMPLSRKSDEAQYGFGFSGYHGDDFGGGGGGSFPPFLIFIRPHPIEVFTFPKFDDLEMNGKVLNEEHHVVMEYLSMLGSSINEKSNEVIENCNCNGACNCATFVSSRDSSSTSLVNVRVPGMLHAFSLEVPKVCGDQKYFWKNLLKEIFGLQFEDVLLFIDKKPLISCRQIIPSGANVDIIPKGLGGVRPKKEILHSTRDQSSSSESDSDPDYRTVNRGPLLWNEDSSNDDESASDGNQHLVTSDEEHRKSTSYEENVEINPITKKTSTSRKMRAVSTSAIAKALEVNCCKGRQCINALDHCEIKEWRRYFWEISEQQQRQYILDAFSLSILHDGTRRQYNLKINGKETCPRAWYLALGISKGWFYGLLKEFESGRVSGESMRAGRTWTTRRSRQAVMWLKSHIEMSADIMPHKDKLCLPSCQSKAEIFQLYSDELQYEKLKTISFTQFRRLWKEHFRNVIIPKQNRFTRCGVCTLIKHSLGTTRGQERRAKLAQKKRVHLRQQSAERNHYYGNRLKAEMNPKKYLSLILDGMDQAKTNIPHVTRISKAEPSHYMKTHITGAISHGNRRCFSFIDLLSWKHDSNLTMNLLLTLFLKLSKKGRLPPILLLQMDNCYRECKNKFIMAFAAYLVQKEIFKEIHISFLMVGHTHEDIDQFFSRIALKLERKNVMTVPELHQIVTTAYEPTPESEDVQQIFDISGWLKPSIVTIRNHVYPHAFKFFLASDKKAKMSYKNWAEDKLWLPDEPISILSTEPEGVPQIIRPVLGGKLGINLDDLQSNVAQSSTRMTDEQVIWWQKFLHNEKKLQTKWETITEGEKARLAEQTWPLRFIKKYQIEVNSVAEAEEVRQDDELERLMNKENHFPPIQVRTTRKRAARDKKGMGGKEGKKKKALNHNSSK